MGIYLNPGNAGFQAIRNQKYIDKSGMLSIINQRIGTKDNLIAVSRPRRFGKSYAAQMLCAYYDESCDSAELFDDLEISKDASYRKHMNQYNVIYLDIASVISDAGDAGRIVPLIKRQITREIMEAFPSAAEEEIFSGTLIHAVEQSGKKFIVVIDEWDVMVRDKTIPHTVQKEYLEFLRMLFKNSGTTDKIFAAAYITGILPIKKDRTQSAISNFKEFTMLRPWKFAEYVGFTQTEVQELCAESNMDFRIMKQWYDGYIFEDAGSVYNPNSVMEAITYRKFASYWQTTAVADSLLQYISMDFQGLSKSVAELLGGVKVKININGFKNDVVGLKSKDDILTMLVHFGYLSYMETDQTICIPNEEIRREFVDAVRQVELSETIRRVKESDQLIRNVTQMRENEVALQIEKVHEEETDPRHYNSEEVLRSVIKLAFFCYRDYYIKFEELAGGKGYSDIVYLPKRDSVMPALVVELKWDHSACGAIEQIKDRNYPACIADYGGEILLVGISYEKDAVGSEKKHCCKIEKWEKS